MEIRNKFLKGLKEYVVISFGMFLYCFSWTSFLTPHDVVGGGVAGLAAVIQIATGGFVEMWLPYMIINVGLVILGTIMLGRGFGFKTIYCILFASLLYKILPDLIPWVADISEPFLVALVGGAIGAVGISIIFTQGGSTGGTDIVALIVSKYREVSPGKVFMICDLLIVGSMAFVSKENGGGLQAVIYGYLQMMSFSFSLDYILMGSKQSVQMLIFSPKYQEIADALVNTMDRGVTAFDGVGWYTKHTNKILIVVAKKHQLSEINKVIKNIDKTAFISVTQAMGVYGRGFDEIKGGGKIQWKRKQNESLV